MLTSLNESNLSYLVTQLCTVASFTSLRFCPRVSLQKKEATSMARSTTLIGLVVACLALSTSAAPGTHELHSGLLSLVWQLLVYMLAWH